MMVIMVLVTIFILCFPTLGSAMTGYVANNDAYVQGSDGMLIPFDGFEVVGYVIHDGWRIAMEGNTTLTFPGRECFFSWDLHVNVEPALNSDKTLVPTLTVAQAHGHAFSAA